MFKYHLCGGSKCTENELVVAKFRVDSVTYIWDHHCTQRREVAADLKILLHSFHTHADPMNETHHSIYERCVILDICDNYSNVDRINNRNWTPTRWQASRWRLIAPKTVSRCQIRGSPGKVNIFFVVRVELYWNIESTDGACRLLIESYCCIALFAINRKRKLGRVTNLLLCCRRGGTRLCLGPAILQQRGFGQTKQQTEEQEKWRWEQQVRLCNFFGNLDWLRGLFWRG